MRKVISSAVSGVSNSLSNVAGGVSNVTSTVGAWPRTVVIIDAATGTARAVRAGTSFGITGLGNAVRLTGTGLERIGTFVEPTQALQDALPTPGRLVRVRSALPSRPSRGVVVAFGLGVLTPIAVSVGLQVRHNYENGLYTRHIKRLTVARDSVASLPSRLRRTSDASDKD